MRAAIQNKVKYSIVSPVMSFYRSRNQREQRLIALTLLSLTAIVFYRGFLVLEHISTIFEAQQSRLSAEKDTLDMLLDPERSPLEQFHKLSHEAKMLQANFEQRLQSDGGIAKLERLLNKHLDPKLYSLNEKTSQSYGGSYQKNTFAISFKSGSLEEVAKILSDIEGKNSIFTLTSLRLEKTFKKYLNVEVQATSIRKEGR